MNMKRIISLALAAILILPLCSCGKDTKGVSSDKNKGSAPTEQSGTGTDRDTGTEAPDGRVNDTDGLIDNGTDDSGADSSRTFFGVAA